jgi:hypothetical protein
MKRFASGIVGGCAVRSLKALLVFLMGRTPCEAGKGAQVGPDERVGQSLQHGRSNYHALRTFGQHLHDEIAFLQRREARPDRNIEAFAGVRGQVVCMRQSRQNYRSTASVL